ELRKWLLGCASPLSLLPLSWCAATARFAHSPKHALLAARASSWQMANLFLSILPRPQQAARQTAAAGCRSPQAEAALGPFSSSPDAFLITLLSSRLSMGRHGPGHPYQSGTPRVSCPRCRA